MYKSHDQNRPDAQTLSSEKPGRIFRDCPTKSSHQIFPPKLQGVTPFSCSIGHAGPAKSRVGQLNRVNPRRPSDRTHPSDRNMAGTDLRIPWPAFVLSYRWIACCVRCCMFGRGPRRSSLVGSLHVVELLVIATEGGEVAFR